MTTPQGTSATGTPDHYTYYATPTVSNVNPNAGTTTGGTSVIITGTNFIGATVVKFGTINATSFTVNSATQITATSPAAAAGTVDVTVTNPGGTSGTTSSDHYTYYVTPTVTNVNPNAGTTAGGTSVIITGTSFTGATSVKFGSTSASFTVNSATQITATSPAESAGTVDVTVTNPGGTSGTSSADQYTYYATPTVTNVSPNAGSTAGGNSVIITGTSFTGATAVTFGSTTASFIVNTPTQITAIAPAESAGTVNVTVTNPGGTSPITSADQYTYYATPVVTGISPPSGSSAGGNSVVITGTNFTGILYVSFGANNAPSFIVNSSTQITATSPAGSANTTVDVTVTNPGGTSATSSADEFTYETTPTVTNVSPMYGPTTGGTSVTITGTGFFGTTAVKFGSTNATSFTVNSITQITATSPSGSGTIDITVTTPQGTSATSSADEFTYETTPTVTNVSPNYGPLVGSTSVTITGTGFLGASAVNFGSTSALSYTVNSSTQITATSPPGSGTVDITVTTPQGTSTTSSADEFTYETTPTVTNVSPNFGPTTGGTTVTITGTGFLGASAVKFGSTNATSFTVNSSTQITATSPSGSGTVDITVTTPQGTSTTSSADQFTYETTPTVTNVSPNYGSTTGGTSVTITGTEFLGVSAVNFGSTSATSYTVNSSTQITATSPPGSGTVDIQVTTPDGTSAVVTADQYTYNSVPIITGLSSTSGPATGGNSVVITGTGFLGTTNVSFGANSASFTVNSNTQITAIVPPEIVGLARTKDTVGVTVTTPEGTSLAFFYTYLSMSVNAPQKFHGTLYRKHHLKHHKNFKLNTKWLPPVPATGIAFYRIYEDGKPKYILNANRLKFKKHVRASHHLHRRYQITAINSSGAESQKEKLKVKREDK